MAKGYGATVVFLVADYLEMRACDPWDDELWPAANAVLMAIAKEIRRDSGDFQSMAWGQFNKSRVKPLTERKVSGSLNK